MMNDERQVTNLSGAATAVLAKYADEFIYSYIQIRKRRQATEMARRYFSNSLLRDAIPTKRIDGTDDKRYVKYRRLAKKFDEIRLSKSEIILDNIAMLNILGKRIPEAGSTRKSKIVYYKQIKPKYEELLKNTCKILNKWWDPAGYRIRYCSEGFCELTWIEDCETLAEQKAKLLLQ